MQESAVAGVARGPTHRRVARRFADEAGTALGADFSAKTVGVAARVEPGHRQAVEGAAARDGDRGAERHALGGGRERSEEHTSELQSLMRNSYAVFCLKKKT